MTAAPLSMSRVAEISIYCNAMPRASHFAEAAVNWYKNGLAHWCKQHGLNATSCYRGAPAYASGTLSIVSLTGLSTLSDVERAYLADTLAGFVADYREAHADITGVALDFVEVLGTVATVRQAG